MNNFKKTLLGGLIVGLALGFTVYLASIPRGVLKAPPGHRCAVCGKAATWVQGASRPASPLDVKKELTPNSVTYSTHYLEGDAKSRARAEERLDKAEWADEPATYTYYCDVDKPVALPLLGVISGVGGFLLVAIIGSGLAGFERLTRSQSPGRHLT